MCGNKIKSLIALIVLVAACPISAQEVRYRYETRIIDVQVPTKITKLVPQKITETEKVTESKQVWHTESRVRTKTRYVPRQRVRERVETHTVRKPVVETKLKTRNRTETTYQTVTKMEEREFTVEKPVRETTTQKKTITVKKPVTTDLVEVTRTTTFKPSREPNTELSLGSSVVTRMVPVADESRRPVMRMLAAGNYTDPETGISVYRRRGLHWVQPSKMVPIAETVPTMVPQTSNDVTYVPEIKEERKPVQVTRMVEETQVVEIPVTVEKVIQTVEKRQVPVEVEIPVVRTITEEIPYTETVYKDEVTTKRVPYTETYQEKVVTEEPYEVEVPSWVKVTKEVPTERTVTKRVEYIENQTVRKSVLFKIPIDINGNDIGEPVRCFPDSTEAAESAPQLTPKVKSQYSIGESTTTPRTTALKSILKTESPQENYTGRIQVAPQPQPKVAAPKEVVETGERKTIEFPNEYAVETPTELTKIGGDSEPADEPAATEDVDTETASGEITKPVMPEATPSGSGDEKTAPTPPRD